MQSNKGIDTMKRMSVKEFRKTGLLQEVNRRFLHPLGLALEVIVEDNGNERFGEIWDCRYDPEGIRFAKNVLDQEYINNVNIREKRVRTIREKALGYWIQS